MQPTTSVFLIPLLPEGELRDLSIMNTDMRELIIDELGEVSGGGLSLGEGFVVFQTSGVAGLFGAAAVVNSGSLAGAIKSVASKYSN